MLMNEKIAYVLKHHHTESLKRNALDAAQYGRNRLETEKGDIPAMLISAFLVILPAVVLALTVMVGIAYLFVIR